MHLAAGIETESFVMLIGSIESTSICPSSIAVTTACLHVRPRPDADAATNPSSSDSFAKALGEDHGQPGS